MQPCTVHTRQSTIRSSSSGTSMKIWAMQTPQLTMQVTQRMQSSQAVFCLSKRVWTKKRLAAMARPLQQNASSQTHSLACGDPRGPQGHRPPQQTYSSPVISRMSFRCMAAMQHGQQQPKHQLPGAMHGVENNPICHSPVSFSETSTFTGIACARQDSLRSEFYTMDTTLTYKVKAGRA
mmetsp:Transcript_52384/g.125132  ORF Transcript_52384/g.125132 Transcript_52384/m.125132 type:complete len:179 (+) Transcript_52384:411-947(+)